MPGLRQGWSKTRYQAGRQSREEDDDAGGDGTSHCDLDTVDNAIKSKRFWAYQCMVDLLATFFLFVSHWVDSCPCHCLTPGADELTPGRRQGYWRKLAQVSACIMSCRRGPEMACGELKRLMGVFLSTASSSLLCELNGMGVPAADVGVIMRDLAAARRHVFFIFHIKCSH